MHVRMHKALSEVATQDHAENRNNYQMEELELSFFVCLICILPSIVSPTCACCATFLLAYTLHYLFILLLQLLNNRFFLSDLFLQMVDLWWDCLVHKLRINQVGIGGLTIAFRYGQLVCIQHSCFLECLVLFLFLRFCWRLKLLVRIWHHGLEYFWTAL